MVARSHRGAKAGRADRRVAHRSGPRRQSHGGAAQHGELATRACISGADLTAPLSDGTVWGRERAEEQLAESEARYRALTEISGDVTRILDVDGTIRYASVSQRAVLGVEPAAVVGHTSFEFMDRESVPRARATLAEVVATARTQRLVSRLLHADGTYHTFEAIMQNQLDEPAVRGVVINSRDITGRIAAEDALLTLARQRSDFVARVSHELRAPLTAIIGFGELLQSHWEEFSDARRLARVDQILVAARREERLVEDLLLVSRLEAASLEMRFTSTALPPLVRQAAAELQASYPGQRVVCEGPSSLWVWGDAARVAQVLSNLLDNAAKYSPEGSSISVSWVLDGSQVVLDVRDQGDGIAESGRELLFTRFGRVRGSHIRPGHAATGLGLYVSRSLAQAMGGDLELAATGTQGSVFRLRLPVTTAEETRAMHLRGDAIGNR